MTAKQKKPRNPIARALQSKIFRGKKFRNRKLEAKNKHSEDQ